MLNLAGQVVLVTGGSQGIGRAIALTVARLGADVAVLARSLDKCESVAGEVEALGVRSLAVRCDLANGVEIVEAVKQVSAGLGPVTTLVNNAAITRDGLMLRMKREDWDTVIATNLTGVFLMTQQVLPMMTRARKGRIINITSVVAQAGNAGQVNYISAKAGIIGMTKAVAREYASRNITVNAVAPGTIATELAAKAVLTSDEAKAKIMSRTPMKRLGEPSEIADTVAYLASDAASYITGEIVVVDGGRMTLNYTVPV